MAKEIGSLICSNTTPDTGYPLQARLHDSPGGTGTCAAEGGVHEMVPRPQITRDDPAAKARGAGVLS